MQGDFTGRTVSFFTAWIAVLNMLMILCSQECMPLARWSGRARHDEFWVRVDAWKVGREWPGGRPLVGWFRGGCYLFLAASVPGRTGFASTSSRI